MKIIVIKISNYKIENNILEITNYLGIFTSLGDKIELRTKTRQNLTYGKT